MQILIQNPDRENFIREQMELGRFASPTEVVEAALWQLLEPQFSPGELDRLIAEGEASIAKHGLLKAEDVFDELREKSRIARLRAGNRNRL